MLITFYISVKIIAGYTRLRCNAA